jgi:hypothetical protein
LERKGLEKEVGKSGGRRFRRKRLEKVVGKGA